MEKIHVNYRVTVDEKKIIEAIAKHLGVSETDVIKLSIRHFSEVTGVKKELARKFREQEKRSSRDFSEVE